MRSWPGALSFAAPLSTNASSIRLRRHRYATLFHRRRSSVSSPSMQAGPSPPASAAPLTHRACRRAAPGARSRTTLLYRNGTPAPRRAIAGQTLGAYRPTMHKLYHYIYRIIIDAFFSLRYRQVPPPQCCQLQLMLFAINYFSSFCRKTSQLR